MKKNKVTVFDGRRPSCWARRQGQRSSNRQGHRGLTAKHIILATGARARAAGAGGRTASWSGPTSEAMARRMPKSLLVIGSGAIGIEFASFYRTLGAEVTVVEVMDRILPVEDEEISALSRARQFEKQGMKILTWHQGDEARPKADKRGGHHRQGRQGQTQEFVDA
jgi:dihydrolipoamide dehydrogenase